MPTYSNGEGVGRRRGYHGICIFVSVKKFCSVLFCSVAYAAGVSLSVSRSLAKNTYALIVFDQVRG